MKNAIAETGNTGKKHQHRIGRAHRQTNGGKAHQGHATEQHAQRAEAIDQKSGEKLSNAGHDEKHRHQKAELGVAQAKRFFDPRKQRRQNEMKKVRRAMGDADQANDLGVAAKRGRIQRQNSAH